MSNNKHKNKSSIKPSFSSNQKRREEFERKTFALQEALIHRKSVDSQYLIDFVSFGFF